MPDKIIDAYYRIFLSLRKVKRKKYPILDTDIYNYWIFYLFYLFLLALVWKKLFYKLFTNTNNSQVPSAFAERVQVMIMESSLSSHKLAHNQTS